MFAFFLIVQSFIAIALIGVILMQRSEGGGLGVGGSSSGFMTARGAADFLTRSTSVLGGLFIVLSIVMAAIAGVTREPVKIDTSLAGKTSQTEQTAPAPVRHLPNPSTQPQQNQQAPAVPLAQ
jgi:preprotein translocase subunit SecG